MYPQENFFDVPIDLNYNLKSLLSGTCVQTYNNGSIYNKPATLLTIEELKEEIINQILVCKELQNDILQNSGFTLVKEDIAYSEIYDDWYWNGLELATKNKKWVNNYYNEYFKPSQITKYKNLYLSGAHTKTSIRIWSMESACESGKKTANYILNKYKKKKAYIYIHKKPLYFRFFEKIDDMLLFYKLPSVFIVFFIIFLFYIIKKIIT
jgi:hypothetical protein